MSRSGDIYADALRRLRPALLFVIGFSAILNVLMLTGSVYMLQVYDRVLSSGSVPTLIGLFSIVVVLYGFLGFYDFLRVRILSRSGLEFDRTLGSAAFRQTLGSDAKEGGASALRDLDTLRGFLSGPAILALFDLPFLPLYLGVLYLIHPWLGGLTVAGAAIAVAIAVATRALTHSANQKAARLDDAERYFVECGRRSSDAIRAMGMQLAVANRWRKMRDAALRDLQIGSDPAEMLAAASRSFRMLLQSCILTLGAYLVIQGEMSAGMIIAASVLSGRALAPVDQIISHWKTFGRAASARARLKTAFPVSPEDAGPINLPTPRGQITVKNLTCRRDRSDRSERAPILSEINFSLAPGDALGIIGRSASGKTTLAKMLVGAGTPDAGTVRLDGATLDQWEPSRLGRLIGYLPQSVEMLPGTIRDNIARFSDDITDDDVVAAARLTGTHEMILELPNGYATVLETAGGSDVLSGGQLQRLGLARAICGTPRLVVLDEPNSNLDLAGEAALSEAIKLLRSAGSTVILIAHRTSALSSVNKLMVLEAGEIRSFGDRDTVLGKSGQPSARPHLTPIGGQASTERPVSHSIAVQAGPRPGRRSA